MRKYISLYLFFISPTFMRPNGGLPTTPEPNPAGFRLLVGTLALRAWWRAGARGTVYGGTAGVRCLLDVTGTPSLVVASARSHATPH